MSASATINHTPNRPPPVAGLSAFLRFILAAGYFAIATVIARRGSLGLTYGQGRRIAEPAMLVFLLIVGFAAIGKAFDRQPSPVSQQGLVFRKGWLSEVGIGIAIGWALAIVCILPTFLFGGIVLQFSPDLVSFGLLLGNVLSLAFATLAVQVAFRGYPLHTVIRAIGETPAVLLLAFLYALMQGWLVGATSASFAVNIVLSLLLSLTWLRTRALWLAWGLQFAWVASRTIIFGLPENRHIGMSPVVQAEPVGPAWLTGGYFGLDGTWIAFVVMLIAVPFIYRATRELNFVHNAPVFTSGGMAVDLDAAARKQHETATRPEAPEGKPLVQILPATYNQPMPVAADLNSPRSSDPDASLPTEN